jgi:hypothetical protein
MSREDNQTNRVSVSVSVGVLVLVGDGPASTTVVVECTVSDGKVGGEEANCP